jgi:hypothetical protein
MGTADTDLHSEVGFGSNMHPLYLFPFILSRFLFGGTGGWLGGVWRPGCIPWDHVFSVLRDKLHGASAVPSDPSLRACCHHQERTKSGARAPPYRIDSAILDTIRETGVGVSGFSSSVFGLRLNRGVPSSHCWRTLLIWKLTPASQGTNRPSTGRPDRQGQHQKEPTSV